MIKIGLIALLLAQPLYAENQVITYVLDYGKAKVDDDQVILSKGKRTKEDQPILETKSLQVPFINSKYAIIQISIDDPDDKNELENYRSIGVLTPINYTRIYDEAGKIMVERKDYRNDPDNFFELPLDFYTFKVPDPLAGT